MKSIYKNIRIGLSVALVAGTLASCSEDKMDKINKNHDNAHDVEAKFILTDAITSTAFQNIGGDFNHYFSSYVEHEVGINNQLWNAEMRITEVYASSTFNNSWKSLYSSLKNARLVMAKCAETGSQPGNYTTQGMGEVLAALNSALITDAFGDAPFSQAALPELNNGKPQFMTPVLDKQADIYKAVMEYLDSAIGNLAKGDKHPSGPVGNQDVLFGGDAKKWTKLAYGLKARYLMHTLNKAENKTAVLNEVLACLDKAAQSAGEQAAFAVYDGATNQNPFFDFFNSREYLAASKSMYDKLVERKDPRLQRAFVTCLDEKNAASQIKDFSEENLLAPNGKPQQVQRKYVTSIFNFSSDAPTFLQSYHELLFLKAEALVRLNRKDEAKKALKEAVVAGLLNTENNVASALKQTVYPLAANDVPAVTQETAEKYFETQVAARFETDALKETMVQKYIAMWGPNGETVECYNDVRRLMAEGKSLKNFYGFQNENKFPLRAPYGSDEVSANPHLQAAYGNGQYVFTENVWWAGGNR